MGIINQIRQNVFVEEQGLDYSILQSNYDENGLHLGLFLHTKLVACISIYLIEPSDPYASELNLKAKRPYILQFTRRVELPENRGNRFTILMLAHALKCVYELFLPDVVFAMLLGRHRKLKNTYIKYYNFNRTFEKKLSNGKAVVLVHDNDEKLKYLHQQMRELCREYSSTFNFQLPDLSAFIAENTNLREKYHTMIDSKNLYLEPLSISDELPRLSDQARLLFFTQRERWSALLSQHPNHNRIIDIGCGPGVYISQISKLDVNRSRKFEGIDISENMINYAKFVHPKITWNVGNIYKLQKENDTADIINTSFLFIHLLKPYLALKEIYRVLSPGGLLFITDVNDSTFSGPEIIKYLISQHNKIYEGNRLVMNEIEYLGQKLGFQVYDKNTLLVDNSGNDDVPELSMHHARLGKWKMWGLLSFMGQRQEIADEFSKAESFYMSNHPNISIKINTFIFQKPLLPR